MGRVDVLRENGGVATGRGSRRPVVLWWFHFLDMSRLRERRPWVVSFPILGPFAKGLPQIASECTQNHKRNHPRPSFLETTHINKVKAPQHDGTPRSHNNHVEFDRVLSPDPMIGSRQRDSSEHADARRDDDTSCQVVGLGPTECRWPQVAGASRGSRFLRLDA